MKIFILCGGFGTRLNFEGTLKAKPMIMIGKDPIILLLEIIIPGFVLIEKTAPFGRYSYKMFILTAEFSK